MEEAFAAYATPVGGRLLGSHVDGRVAPPVATLSELLTTHATHEWLLSCKVKSSGSRSRPRGQDQCYRVKVNIAEFLAFYQGAALIYILECLFWQNE